MPNTLQQSDTRARFVPGLPEEFPQVTAVYDPRTREVYVLRRNIGTLGAGHLLEAAAAVLAQAAREGR